MVTSPAWTMGTTWQQRQAAGPDWRTELRPDQSAWRDAQRLRQQAQPPSVSSFGLPQQVSHATASSPNLGSPYAATWQPFEGPTSLEDLATNYGSSPTFAPPGLNGFLPPGQGGGTPGGFGFGGGNLPPGLANRYEELFGELPDRPGGPRWSQYASIIGGGSSGGFGGYRAQGARPGYGRPRRRRY